jgi:NADH-quinone oxidoreductase subunit G
LQASVDARRSSVAYLNQSTLSALGLTNGNMVRVAQGQGSALVKAEEDNNLPDNCVRLAAGTATSALLGEMYGSISVERA